MKCYSKSESLNWLKGVVIAALVASPVWADDSDIYILGGQAYNEGILRVMLTLDPRASQGSTICQMGKDGTGCDATWGGTGEDSLLIRHVDIFNRDGKRLSDGYADLFQPSSDSGIAWDPDLYPYDIPRADSVANYWIGEDAELFDAVRTVVRASLEYVADVARANLNKIGGLEVGLMVSHDDTNCAEGSFRCSGGAYVLQGFTNILDDDGLGLETLYRKIGALRYAETDWPGRSNNFSGHPYSLRNIYLEYDRYITGEDQFSAFQGYDDYNSDVNSGNTYHVPPLNDVQFPGNMLGLNDPNSSYPLLSPDLDRPGLDDPFGNRPHVWDSVTPASYDANTSTQASGTYNSPLTATEECSSLYMVHSMFGDTNPASPETDRALEGTAHLGIDLRGLGQNQGDQEVVRQFYRVDFGSTAVLGYDVPGEQNLTSFFLTKQGHNSAKSDENLLARAGGTGTAYELDDPQAMLDTWQFIWGEILSTSTTFVAASVPVNVFDRANSVDNVYFAIFQAEDEVRWNGNVKKLKIVTVNDPFDAGYDPNAPTFDMITHNIDPPEPAISDSDGRILSNALTFWTDPTGADVVAFDPNASPPEISGQDGRSITRGGAGQQIPGYLTDTVGEYNGASGARQVYTEDPDGVSTDGLLALDAQATAAASMSVLSPYLDPNDTLTADDERGLIGWIRGLEDVLVSGASRDWLLSDPMHSRPLVINYGISGGSYTKENPDIRLLFGTNDGVLHVVKNTEDDGSESGQEGFAFLPLELLDMQATLRANGQQSVEPHLYGLDGEPAAYVFDADGDGNIVSGGDSEDFVWFYLGMRRGGKALYAFDMTDPDAPQLKWKITNEMADFEQLGMTFSKPVPTAIDLDGDGTRTPVLIFAGGYNGGWKKDGTLDRVGKDVPGNRDADTVGNAIYVVDADTGSLVWKAVGPGADDSLPAGDTLYRHTQMLHSIPSNISVLDTNGNGMVDRGYVGDTGGNVWRIEFVESALDADSNLTGGPQDWYVTRLGSFAGSDPNDPVGDIRFFHAPDIVQTRDAAGDYDAVIIPSGNRADPLDELAENYLFMIKDRDTATQLDPNDVDIGAADLHDITDCADGTEASCPGALDSDNPTGWDLYYGWKLALEKAGEKGLSKPLTANGKIFFTTYSPSGGTENVCGPAEGLGYGYIVNLKDGTPVFNLDLDVDEDVDKADRFQELGPGIPGDIIVLDSDRLLVPGTGIDAEPFGDGDGDEGCQDQFCRPGGESLWRIYWREEEVDRL